MALFKPKYVANKILNHCFFICKLHSNTHHPSINPSIWWTVGFDMCIVRGMITKVNLTPTSPKTDNIDATDVGRCTILPDGWMMFTCYVKHKVIVIHNNGTKDFEIKQGRNFDIDYTGNNKIVLHLLVNVTISLLNALI